MATAIADGRERASLLAGGLLDNRNVLSVLFMLPAAALLLIFLTYPLGLGIWLGFTDTKIGRPGVFIGLENYISLFQDSVFRLSVFNTLLYTIVATVLKFGLGLWLALLLNNNMPFKAFIRAIVLLPYIVPTVLSAIAFWWIYDPQFSIISWTLVKMGLIDTYIDFLGQPWNARCSVIAANVWRGIPFVAICLLAGSADDLALALRGGGAGRRHVVAALPACHRADADADPVDRADLLGAVHLHRLPADLRDHPRRAGQRHPSDGDARLPARHPRRRSWARVRRSRRR